MLKHSKDSISQINIQDKKIYVSSIDGHIRTYDIRYGNMAVDELHQSEASEIFCCVNSIAYCKNTFLGNADVFELWD